MRKDYSGERFGRLVVVSENRPKFWNCLCDCGEVRVVYISWLRQGRQVSCGCYRRERMSKMGKMRAGIQANMVHGHTAGNRVTVEWRTWKNMKARCFHKTNRSYPRYGGRGITVCDRWKHSFVAFLADMGLKPHPDLTIERIDNDGNYEPGNCKWATKSEQQINQKYNSGRFQKGHAKNSRFPLFL